MKVGLIDVDGHNFPNIALMEKDFSKCETPENKLFELRDFKCQIDGYNNEGYKKSGIPKCLYIDVMKGKKCCFVSGHFSDYCPDCIKEYDKQVKRERRVKNG